MIGLAIGAALVGGAAWAGRAARLGVLITPNMEDHDFIDEMHYRAQEADGRVDYGFRNLYDAARESFSKTPDCAGARQEYMIALDAIKESQRAMRDARIPRLLKECRGRRGTTRGAKCRRFWRAATMHDQATEGLPELRRDIKKACDQTMPRPF